MLDNYVYVGDIKTRYRRMGEKGPALVLLHGLGACLETRQWNIPALAERHRVFAPDVVWFGKTDKPRRPVSLDFFARFVAGFMDAVHLPRAVLVGSSLGGMIAIKTALQYPERVAGLVLVDPAGFGRDLGWALRLRTVFELGKFIPLTPRLARLAAGQLVHDPGIIPDDFLQVLVELANLPGAHEAYHRVLCAGADWRGLKPTALQEMYEAAPALRAPTLILWGKQDRVIPVAHAETARRLIPGAQVHVFERCGHAPMIEKADEFNALVTRFVRENAAAGAVERRWPFRPGFWQAIQNYLHLPVLQG